MRVKRTSGGQYTKSARNACMSLYWVPGYFGIEVNETAELANLGGARTHMVVNFINCVLSLETAKAALNKWLVRKSNDF